MPDELIYVNGKKEITASKLVDIASAIRTAKSWPNDHEHKLTIDQMYDILVAGSDDMELANMVFSGTLGPTLSILPRERETPGTFSHKLNIVQSCLCNQWELETIKIYSQFDKPDDTNSVSAFLCNCPKLKTAYIYVDPFRRSRDNEATRVFFNTPIGDENDLDAVIYVPNETAKANLLLTNKGTLLPSFIYTDEYKDLKIIVDPDM